MNPPLLRAAVLAVLTASTAFAAVTKNTLTPATPQPCGGIWNPPCGTPVVAGGQWCCEQGVTVSYKNGRIVTSQGRRCRFVEGAGACGLFEDYMSCTIGYAVEERIVLAGTGGLLYDVTCRE